MATLHPHQKLQRKALFIMLFAGVITASIAMIIHHYQPRGNFLGGFSHSIGATLGAILSVQLLIWLYLKPESWRKVAAIATLGSALVIILPGWFFTLNAFASTSTNLIDSYPPLTIPIFLWTTVTLVFTNPKHLSKVICVGWLLGAIPVLIYLLLHTDELITPRGTDLFISLGPAMALQTTMVLFYSRLQVLVDKLYTERLQYYSKVIEEQTIRQQAMEQAFSQLHNGPLQSLAVLLRDVQQEEVPSSQVFQRLAELNAEIRDVGQSLTQNSQLEKPVTDLINSQAEISQSTLRLGSGTSVDLSLPLHNLLYEVYSVTLKRQLPYFENIRVKVRNFSPLESSNLTLDLKREICLWLEEALCNVGKHAEGVTRIQVTGKYQDKQYILKVQDNGVGFTSKSGEGTKQSNRLAQKLGGKFRRDSLPKGGVLCELSWVVEGEISSNYY